MPAEDDTPAPSSSDPALDATVPVADDALSSSPEPRRGSPASSRIGRYLLGAPLASERNGSTYRARDPDLERELAIRLVPSASSEAEQDRLISTAKTMAKLRHPHLLEVFDVGTSDCRLFLVTPFIAGGTLHDWLTTARRPWRTVVDRFVAAGRGLQAAHAAGLVHGGFAPRKVLLGERGEVKVAGFRLMGVAAGDAGASGALADQRSFAVGFWEGLHGKLGEAADGDRDESLPPRRGDAPRWLSSALARGFAHDPANRWPSIRDLLDHIEGRLRRRRLVALAAGAILLLVGAAATFTLLSSGPPSPGCVDPAARLDRVWDAGARARVDSAFAALKTTFATEALDRIRPVLDRYASDWRAMHLEACRATHVSKTQSMDVLDRRMVCLDRRLGELRAQTMALALADVNVARNALERATNLPRIEDCADVRTLGSVQPMPASRTERERIEELHRALDELQAFGVRGEPREYLARATLLAEQTRAQAYVPVHVSGLRVLLEAQSANKTPNEATLRELTQAAARAGDDAVVAEAWARLIFELSRRAKHEEAKQLEPAAEAALQRAGRPRSATFQFETARAAVASQLDQLDEAIIYARAALAAASTPFERRGALELLAGSLWHRGQIPDARRALEEALALVEATQGRSHPSYAETLNLFARITQRTGEGVDLDRAERALQEALEIRTAAFGGNHPEVGRTLLTVGELANARSKFGLAETSLRRAVEIFEAHRDNSILAVSLKALGDAVSWQRGLVEARPLYERSLKAAAESFGKDSTDYAATEVSFAYDLAAAKDCRSGRPYALHALEFFERTNNPHAALALNILSMCDFAERNASAGVARLERAIGLCEGGACSVGNLDALRWSLGTELIIRRLDRPRGLTLLRLARRGFVETGRDADVKEADAWLAKHVR